jgi:hypothetical protein
MSVGYNWVQTYLAGEPSVADEIVGEPLVADEVIGDDLDSV